MNKKTKVKLILTGVTLAATLLEGYVSSKVKTDKDKQINKLISEVRDEMGHYSRITHNPESIELDANKINLDGVVSDKYVTKAELDEHKRELNNLQEDLIDLEMSVQAEDDTYSMQDYHNDMKYIEDKLSGMSRETVLAVRDNATGWHQTTKELREFVDHIDVIDNNLKAKEEK